MGQHDGNGVDLERAEPNSELFPSETWQVDEVEPSLLAAGWEDEEPPDIDVSVGALEWALGERLERSDEGENLGAGIFWEVDLRGRRSGQPLALYCQRCPEWFAERVRHPAASASRWFLGVRVTLDPQRPVVSYSQMLRTIAEALPEAPFIHDTDSRRTIDRSFLEDLKAYPGLLVPDAWMWTLDTVQGDGPAEGAWIHTHGLARCGRIELEMLGVPTRTVRDAERLLDAFASWLLDEPTPDPGWPAEAAGSRPVAFVPWEIAAWRLPKTAPGATVYRCYECPRGHTAPRAAICAPRRTDQGWVWAADAVAAVDSLRRSSSAVEREATIARALLGEFQRAFRALRGEAHGPPRARESFLLQLDAPPVAERDTALWLEVTGWGDGRLHGIVLEGPWEVRKPGDDAPVAVDTRRIRGWQVVTPKGEYGPTSVGALRLYCLVEGRSPGEETP